MEDKFGKFSLWVFIFGVVVALFMIINTIVHTSIGSTIKNKPLLAPDQMFGPNAKY